MLARSKPEADQRVLRASLCVSCPSRLISLFVCRSNCHTPHVRVSQVHGLAVNVLRVFACPLAHSRAGQLPLDQVWSALLPMRGCNTDSAVHQGNWQRLGRFLHLQHVFRARRQHLVGCHIPSCCVDSNFVACAASMFKERRLKRRLSAQSTRCIKPQWRHHRSCSDSAPMLQKLPSRCCRRCNQARAVPECALRYNCAFTHRTRQSYRTARSTRARRKPAVRARH